MGDVAALLGGLVALQVEPDGIRVILARLKKLGDVAIGHKNIIETAYSHCSGHE